MNHLIANFGGMMWESTKSTKQVLAKMKQGFGMAEFNVLVL